MPAHRRRLAALAALATLVAAAAVAGCSTGPSRPAPAPAPSTVIPATVIPATVTPATVTPATVTPATVTSASVPGSTGARSAAAPASATRIPPLSARARRAGLVDIRTVVPDAIVDLRYATKTNFTHVQLYPSSARCLVHTSLRSGLRRAADRLRRSGYRLVFWDCYRPHSVQVRMFQVVPDPDWVARPGSYARSHEAGRSVDVTLAYASTGRRCAHPVRGHCVVEMGTDFDDFTARAHAYATAGVSAQAEANRARLRAAMRAGGIAVYSGEWWHFDGPGAATDRPHLDAPLH